MLIYLKYEPLEPPSFFSISLFSAQVGWDENLMIFSV